MDHTHKAFGTTQLSIQYPAPGSGESSATGHHPHLHFFMTDGWSHSQEVVWGLHQHFKKPRKHSVQAASSHLISIQLSIRSETPLLTVKKRMAINFSCHSRIIKSRVASPGYTLHPHALSLAHLLLKSGSLTGTHSGLYIPNPLEEPRFDERMNDRLHMPIPTTKQGRKSTHMCHNCYHTCVLFGILAGTAGGVHKYLSSCLGFLLQSYTTSACFEVQDWPVKRMTF